MARVIADDEGGPAAFGVRLSGINKNGRPSEPKRIHVRKSSKSPTCTVLIKLMMAS